ncbi:hypothetical protein [Candidatus Methylobacter oryzae]|uniref:Uncharacterized protein n=1 Tax=Candidatus Methylobacter oryzae TaxID=2497749 RepID=A0ABY3C6C8_9GAMM|nr:hypothetical protein [Candidatus Methylobacter oryzae]TRW90785.1 hypothetical protein EKO24_018485 [Candidatus Methylobacter oryzae]
MNLLEKFLTYERFEMDWRRLLVQGILIALTGATLAMASAFNPNAIVLTARHLSWLPVSGMVILSLGLLECLDAALTKEPRDFLQNLQVGVLDAVIGTMIILSVTEEPSRLSMMIATFLIVRGIVRATLAHALQLPHILVTSLGGLISVIMGFLIWKQWPTGDGWFMSICLNIEIAVRGWAMMTFALWVRTQNVDIDSD